jgi:hypothetical protein
MLELLSSYRSKTFSSPPPTMAVEHILLPTEARLRVLACVRAGLGETPTTARVARGIQTLTSLMIVTFEDPRASVGELSMLPELSNALGWLARLDVMRAREGLLVASNIVYYDLMDRLRDEGPGTHSIPPFMHSFRAGVPCPEEKDADNVRALVRWLAQEDVTLARRVLHLCPFQRVEVFPIGSEATFDLLLAAKPVNSR